MGGPIGDSLTPTLFFPSWLSLRDGVALRMELVVNRVRARPGGWKVQRLGRLVGSEVGGEQRVGWVRELGDCAATAALRGHWAD